MLRSISIITFLFCFLLPLSATASYTISELIKANSTLTCKFTFYLNLANTGKNHLKEARVSITPSTGSLILSLGNYSSSCAKSSTCSASPIKTGTTISWGDSYPASSITGWTKACGQFKVKNKSGSDITTPIEIYVKHKKKNLTKLTVGTLSCQY